MNAPDPLASFLDAADPIYGAGVDGSVTLDGTTTVLGMAPSSNKYTMTSDLYFHNLTINSSVHLQPNGYRIFVKNILTMGNGSRIGFTEGFDTAGSILQGAGLLAVVPHSLGGSGLYGTCVAPTEPLGGPKYFEVPRQAVTGYSITASGGPTFLRGGGAGGPTEPGGGVVILAARHIGVSSGTAYISAPGLNGAGGGVVIIVSSHSALPAGLTTDVTGENPGTVNYMQLV